MDVINETAWSRVAWDASISARAYNADWWDTLTPTKEPQLWAEMHSIYAEEKALSTVPPWAAAIVTRMMELPMCGYYAFPDNITQVLDAISTQQCPDVVMRCYTVDPDRKNLMSYYVFCLDAWAKDAPLSTPVAELTLRGSLGMNWKQIATAIYQTLGERTEIKRITIERLIHRLRWWIKSLIWLDDKRDRFMLDLYAGNIRGDEEPWGAYGNSPYGDPYFTELQLPYVKDMENRILAEVPDGRSLLVRIQSTWLCAPKVFRYLEKLIAEIGAIGSDQFSGDIPSFLQCEHTYPDFAANLQQYKRLTDKLRQWLDGCAVQLPAIEASSHVQRWLVHILWHKLVFHGTYEENFGKMVGVRSHGKSGTKHPGIQYSNPQYNYEMGKEQNT